MRHLETDVNTSQIRVTIDRSDQGNYETSQKLYQVSSILYQIHVLESSQAIGSLEQPIVSGIIMSVLNDGVIDRTDGNGQPQAYKIDKDFGTMRMRDKASKSCLQK